MKTQSYWRNSNFTYRDRDYSPVKGQSLWELCPQLALLDPGVGFTFFEDFLKFALDDTTANPTEWKYQSDTAGGAVTTPASLLGGVINVATGASDNNETYIQLGGLNTFEPFVITNGNGKPLWFEARVKALSHDDFAVFVGLAEAGCAAANFLADNTGVPADKDFIGFRFKCDDSAAWDAAWRKNGQAEQEIAGAAVNADDWHKFGFWFDGASTVYYFIDGVIHATTATVSAATFPGGEEMSPIIAIKTGSGNARHIQVDYIKVVQIR